MLKILCRGSVLSRNVCRAVAVPKLNTAARRPQLRFVPKMNFSTQSAAEVQQQQQVNPR